MSSMKLWDFPEYNAALTSSHYEEWLETIPVLLNDVKEARAYFYQKEKEVVSNRDEGFDITTVNPGYIYILDQCIELAEKKRAINDSLKEGMNDEIYEEMTWRRGYESTLASAAHLRDAFFIPSLYESLKTRYNDIFFGRDQWEQAARICEYILKYLDGYNKDHVIQDTQDSLKEAFQN